MPGDQGGISDPQRRSTKNSRHPFFIHQLTFVLFCFLVLAAPRGTWDVSSPTRNRTCTPCSGSLES